MSVEQGLSERMKFGLWGIARALLWSSSPFQPIRVPPGKIWRQTVNIQAFRHTAKMEAVDSTTSGQLKENQMTNGQVKQTNVKESPESKKPRITPPEDEEPVLEYAKLSENAYAPVRGSANAAGYDLYSAKDMVVPAHGKEKIPTDIQIAVPAGCYGRVAPRSGLASKHFIDVGAGVIDRDYRGNVIVLLFNFGDQDFVVNKGDRIAQLVLEKICIPVLKERNTLDVTERGDGGFGSTGVKANGNSQ